MEATQDPKVQHSTGDSKDAKVDAGKDTIVIANGDRSIEATVAPVKRGRGRPRIHSIKVAPVTEKQQQQPVPAKKPAQVIKAKGTATAAKQKQKDLLAKGGITKPSAKSKPVKQIKQLPAKPAKKVKPNKPLEPMFNSNGERLLWGRSTGRIPKDPIWGDGPPKEELTDRCVLVNGYMLILTQCYDPSGTWGCFQVLSEYGPSHIHPTPYGRFGIVGEKFPLEEGPKRLAYLKEFSTMQQLELSAEQQHMIGPGWFGVEDGEMLSPIKSHKENQGYEYYRGEDYPAAGGIFQGYPRPVGAIPNSDDAYDPEETVSQHSDGSGTANGVVNRVVNRLQQHAGTPGTDSGNTSPARRFHEYTASKGTHQDDSGMAAAPMTPQNHGAKILMPKTPHKVSVIDFNVDESPNKVRLEEDQQERDRYFLNAYLSTADKPSDNDDHNGDDNDDGDDDSNDDTADDEETSTADSQETVTEFPTTDDEIDNSEDRAVSEEL